MIRKGSSRMSKQHQWMCFQGGNKRTAFASFGTSNNFLRSVKSSFVALSTKTHYYFYCQLLFISLKDLFTLNYPFLLDFLGPFKIKLGVLSVMLNDYFTWFTQFPYWRPYGQNQSDHIKVLSLGKYVGNGLSILRFNRSWLEKIWFYSNLSRTKTNELFTWYLRNRIM